MRSCKLNFTVGYRNLLIFAQGAEWRIYPVVAMQMGAVRTPFYAVSAAIRNFAPLVAQYKVDGYAVCRNVLDPGFVEEMRDHVAFLQRKYPDVPTEHLHHLILRNDPFWTRIALDPRLLDLAQVRPQVLCASHNTNQAYEKRMQSFAPFLSNGVALFSSHYFLKKPKTGMPVLWHQDGSYWPLRPMNVMTLWLAVDSSTRDNGCLRVVPKSHLVPLQELKADRSVLNVLGSATHTDGEIPKDSIVDLELQPGDVSVHHPNIIHGSNANNSDSRRCGLTIRYISPATECTDPEQPVMLLRGEAMRGKNQYRSWPRYRPGYDMPFAGCEDEPFFDRTDFDVIESEIKSGLESFITKLGGR